MATPPSTPTSELGYQPRRSEFRVLWKWSFLLLAALMAWGMWQCGSALLLGSRLTDVSVRHFHAQLNAGKYEEICGEAHEQFVGPDTRAEILQVLKGVHEKLGTSSAEERLDINVNASTGGTFVTARYNTNFAVGPAVETFTWIKTGNALKLYGYNIESKALLLR